MMKRSVSIALTFGLTLALGSSALAGPKPIPGKQEAVQRAVTGLDIRVKSQRFVTTSFGRNDLVLQSSTPMSKLAAEFDRAYRNDLQLADGYVVSGWAKLVDGTCTATLRKGNERIIVEARRDGSGSEIAIWGFVIDPTQRSPQRALPSPKPRLNR